MGSHSSRFNRGKSANSTMGPLMEFRSRFNSSRFNRSRLALEGFRLGGFQLDPGADLETTALSTFDLGGKTWTIQVSDVDTTPKEMPVAVIDDLAVIVSTEAFCLVPPAMTTETITGGAGTPTQDYQRGGHEENPGYIYLYDSPPGAQQYDEALAEFPDKPTFTLTFQTPPSNYSYGVGDEAVVVGQVPQPLADILNKPRTARYTRVIVLADTPAADFITVPASGNVKDVWSESDISLSSFPQNFSVSDLTSAGITPVATLLALDAWARFEPRNLIDELLRPSYSQAWEDDYSTDYSAIMGRVFSELAMWLFSDTSDANRLAVAKVLLPHAVEQLGAYRAGQLGASAAGQGFLPSLLLAVGAYMTGNTEMLAASKAIVSNEVNQAAWGDDWMVPVPEAANSDRYLEPPMPSEAGLPFFSFSGDGHPGTVISQTQAYNISTAPNFRYRNTSSTSRLPCLMVIAQLDGTPWGWADGLDTYYKGGSFSTATKNAAMIAYNILEQTSPSNKNRTPAWAVSLWASHYAAFNIPTYNPQPQQPHPVSTVDGSGELGVITANTGSLSWDLSSVVAGQNYSTSPITGVSVAYSQDGLQWEFGTGATGTTVSLSNAQDVWVSVSLSNAQGDGPYSSVARVYDSATETNGKITVGGSAGGTTVNEVAPKIVEDIATYWAYGRGPEKHGAVDSLNSAKFYLGSGLWSGTYTAPVLDLEVNDGGWVSSGLNIDYFNTFARVAALPAQSGLECRIASTVNGVTAYSASKTLPTINIGLVQSTSEGVSDGAGGTATVTPDATPSDGNVMRAYVTRHSGQSVTPPSGWTLTNTWSLGQSKDILEYKKTASSETGGYAFTLAGRGTVIFVEIDGDTGNQVAASDSSLTRDPPSVTATGGDRDYLVLAFSVDKRGGGYGTYSGAPAGFFLQEIANSTTGASSASSHSQTGFAFDIQTDTAIDPGEFSHAAAEEHACGSLTVVVW